MFVWIVSLLDGFLVPPCTIRFNAEFNTSPDIVTVEAIKAYVNGAKYRKVNGRKVSLVDYF